MGVCLGCGPSRRVRQSHPRSRQIVVEDGVDAYMASLAAYAGVVGELVGRGADPCAADVHGVDARVEARRAWRFIPARAEEAARDDQRDDAAGNRAFREEYVRGLEGALGGIQALLRLRGAGAGLGLGGAG